MCHSQKSSLDEAYLDLKELWDDSNTKCMTSIIFRSLMSHKSLKKLGDISFDDIYFFKF